MKKWLLFLIASPAFCAEAPLSWQDCVELASRNSAALKASAATAEAQRLQQGAALNGFFPQISGNLGWNHSNSQSVITGTTLTSDAYTASLTGTQNLFSGFQDLGKFKQARANAKASLAALQTVKAQVSYDLKAAYEGLLYSQEYSKLTLQIIQRRQENLNLVRLRFASGRENQGSVLLSQAYLDQARYDDLQANDLKHMASAQLSRVISPGELDLGDSQPMQLSGNVPTSAPPQPRPEFKSLALGTPDYAQAQALEEAAGASVTVARSAFFPSLNVTGTASKQGDEFFPQDTNRWSIGVNLSIPLFNGGRDLFATRSASAAWASSESSRFNVSRLLLTKLEQAYAAFLESEAKFKVDASFLKASQVRAEIARKKYNNGLLTFEDWDIIESDLITRQKSYLQSKRDRVLSEAAWEQAQGRGVIP